MFNEEQNKAPFMAQAGYDQQSQEAEEMSISAVFAMEKATTESQVATAKRYPRNLARVQAQMKNYVSLDAETAASCFYKLPRGGKNIEGPSVRLAEIAFSSFQNAKVGTRILEIVTIGPTPHVVIQAVAIDLENNIAVSIEKRRRITKKKSKEFIDEDDIQLGVNACSAVAYRDVVFKMIPRTLYDPVYKYAKTIAVGDQKTLPDRTAKAIEAFQKLGIKKDAVLGKFGYKKESEITLDDLETLIGIFSAVKDGELSIDEAFIPNTQEDEPRPAPDPKPQTSKRQTESKPKLAIKPETDEKPVEANVESSNNPSLISQFYTMVSECEFGFDVMESDVLAFIKKVGMHEGDCSTLEEVPKQVLITMINEPDVFKGAWMTTMVHKK